MGKFFAVLGIIVSLLMIKYREKVGENVGEAEWMNKIGGVYNFVLILAVIMFFWSVAGLTGTTGIFFAPLRMVFGGIFGLNNSTPIEEF